MFKSGDDGHMNRDLHTGIDERMSVHMRIDENMFKSGDDGHMNRDLAVIHTHIHTCIHTYIHTYIHMQTANH